MTIIVAHNLGAGIADVDGICQGQSVTAGALTLTINGSLTAGGIYLNRGAAHKIVAHSAGDDSSNSLTCTGRFWASNAIGGDYTNTVVIDLGNATSVTSTLYAEEISLIVAATITASSITVGLTNDSTGVPVSLPYGSLWQFSYAGTIAGATVQVKKYVKAPANGLTEPVAGEWVGIDSGTNTASLINYEIPPNSVVKAFLTSGSTTTQAVVLADIIQKTK